MLRTIAIWNRAPLVMVPLVIASLGQWGMLLRGGVTVRSRWSDPAGACVTDADHPRVIEGGYLCSELSTRNFSCPLPVVGTKQDPDAEHSDVV